MTKSKGIGRGGHNKIKINIVRLRKDYQDRRSVTSIAKEYGVTIQTIYARLKQLGITRSISESCKGRKVWNAGKGKGLNCWGYKCRQKNGKPEFEHRKVAEQILGRKLTRKEVVHHINGDKLDNRPENLEVFPSHSEHMKHHITTEEARRRGKFPKKRRACLKAKGVEVE